MAVTDEQKKRIIQALSMRLSQRAAAQHAKVSRKTIYNLKQRDKEFAEQCEGATEMLKGNCVTRILKAGDKDWRALAWILERMFKSEFSKAEVHANVDKDEFDSMTFEEKTEELERLNKKLEKIDRRARDKESRLSKKKRFN